MFTLFDPVLLSTACIRINLIYVIQYCKMVFQTKQYFHVQLNRAKTKKKTTNGTCNAQGNILQQFSCKTCNGDSLGKGMVRILFYYFSMIRFKVIFWKQKQDILLNKKEYEG